MSLMKTKEKVSTVNRIQITLNVPVPNNDLSSEEVQSAWSIFFDQNPQIGERVFESWKNSRKKIVSVNSFLPQLTQEQREKAFNDLQKLEDDDIDDLPLKMRSSKTQQLLDVLDNIKPSSIKGNSTQILRDIRDNG